MTTDDLREKVAENVAELSEVLHQAVIQKQYGNAIDAAKALAEAAAAHRDLTDD